MKSTLLFLSFFLISGLFGQIHYGHQHGIDCPDDTEYLVQTDDFDNVSKMNSGLSTVKINSGGHGVFVCKFCGHVREYSWKSGEKWYPPHTPCPKYWEGHFSYRVGLPGPNKYECMNCHARVSVRELGFDYRLIDGCLNKYKHNWKRRG